VNISYFEDHFSFLSSFLLCPLLTLDLISSRSTSKSMEEKKVKPDEQSAEESAFQEALLEFQ